MKPVVKIEHGPNGWGGPLLVSETDTRTVVASVTGGGIHPLAQRTADLLGVKAVDGFNNKVAPETIIVAFVDCGGTARCGVYPKMGVKTVDVLPIDPSGPLARFINEDNFCSGVTPDKITIAEGEAAMDTEDIEAVTSEVDSAESVQPTTNTKGVMGAITRVGRAVGGVVQTFNQAARNTLDIVIKNIIPFMMFISVIVGIVNYTGIGTILANLVKPLAGSFPGLLCLSISVAFHFCHLYSDLVRLLRRLSELSLVMKSVRVFFRLLMHFRHSLLSIHRSDVTLSQLHLHLLKQRTRQLRLVYRRCCSQDC